MSQQERAEGRTKYGSVPYAAPRQPQPRQIRHGIDKRPIRVGFVGNPNCGKTTLFNAFTGAKLKVANWPGVTVERVEGETNYKGRPIKVIDLPGIYSLTSYTIEEKVTRKCIEDGEVDVIINVVDASSLERNLYLTMQLIELKKPVILALNMMDIVEERGMEIDMHRLPEMLGGIPVVPVSARKRTGLDVLMHAVVHHYEEEPQGVVIHYSPQVEEKITRIEGELRRHYGEMDNMRWHAIKFLEFDEVVTSDHPLDVSGILDHNYEKQIINEKYDYIEEVIQECLMNKEEKAATTDKADRILTHRIWGIPVFLGIMALVFFLTFTVGDFLKGYFQVGLDWFSQAVVAGLASVHASSWLTSLIVDGIIAGVGGILTFLPNIFILFLALAFLEDSGYMARVAYVMNETMGMVGLSGKAFLPMLLGFGCTVPAVMATRALESVRDRRRTILITPFMSCSARLPIYVLFAEMFFPRHALFVAYSLYLIGLVMAILVAFILHKNSRGTRSENALLIELPEYKTPNGRTVAIYVWDKVKDYLSKAGTTIFIASIVLWFVLNTGTTGFVSDVQDSFAAMIGHVLVPVLRPAGLGLWQVAVALISGLSAKEVVVSSFSVLFGISNVNSAAGMGELSAQLTSMGFGGVNAYALMIFCLMYSPCIAAVATIKRETGSWRWTLGMVLFQLLVAWAAAVLVFQVGSLLFG
ncbi:ferrous iron transport protein B [Enterocloster lavalensis]|uniref:Ferrous iron transport protein B n=1 Tax=Enterocloster lavalensis TaxID=460384 RepID=A0A1I0FSZ8_9FIRM|nr:ferrous iron transport protein B [Enterocloster lavalensis]MBS5604432.1 ferrous iron transport protein B [Enterocloster asparagiformis]PST32985.1 ferrous iron transport protein B [Enterocloster lavalensis]SET60517.1 ferrous iron transport protein B [Enterocloster lavalensis]